MLTEVQKRFIALDLKKAQYKKFLDEYREVTEALVQEIGLNGHFQDADGIVYQATNPSGRFVAYEKFRIERTRRLFLEEKKGGLSLKAARELGYKVE